MHLVGIKGKFIYTFDDGTETSLTPGAYVFLPGGKVHAERCGDEEVAVFYLYFEQPVDHNPVTEKK
jgi:quercetin dioxygenase-like cupin family protein